MQERGLAPAVIALAYCGYRWAMAVALEKDFSSWFWVLAVICALFGAVATAAA